MLPKSFLYLTVLKPNLNVTNESVFFIHLVQHSIDFTMCKKKKKGFLHSFREIIPNYLVTISPHLIFSLLNSNSSVYSIFSFPSFPCLTSPPSVLLLWQLTLALSSYLFVIAFFNLSFLFISKNIFYFCNYFV